MTNPRPAGTAIGAVAIGAASGGMLLCLVLTIAHGMRRGIDAPFADIALGAGAAGLATAAVVAFAVARPLGPMRAIIAAMIAVSGAALVGVLTTAADIAGGRIGLLILAAMCGSVIVLAWRVLLVRWQ